MRLHHPGVENRDADAAAVELGGVALQVAGAHVVGQGPGDRFEGARRPARDAVRRHARDVTALGQGVNVGRSHLHGQRTKGRMDGVDHAAGSQHGRAQLRHGGIGRVADDDRLDMADAVEVAHPARLGLARLGQTVGQVACDLGLRRQRRGLRVCDVDLRQAEDQDQREEEPSQGGSTPAFDGRNDERRSRFHGGPAEEHIGTAQAECGRESDECQLPLYRQAPALAFTHASVRPTDEAVPVVFNALNARKIRRAQAGAESADASQPAGARRRRLPSTRQRVSIDRKFGTRSPLRREFGP